MSDDQGMPTRLGPLNADSTHAFALAWKGLPSSTANSRMLASTSTYLEWMPSTRSSASATFDTSTRSRGRE